MFYLFIYFFSRREISEMRGPTGVKFCTMVSTKPCFIMSVQNFGGHTPKKFRRQNNAKFGPILDDFEVRRRISLKEKDFQNQIFIPFTAIIPALSETNTVKFSPVILEILMLNRTRRNCIFRKIIFRLPRGCCAPKFYTR